MEKRKFRSSVDSFRTEILVHVSGPSRWKVHKVELLLFSHARLLRRLKLTRFSGSEVSVVSSKLLGMDTEYVKVLLRRSH